MPRWETGNKLTTNDLFDWLRSYKGEALGWKQTDNTQAQELANAGIFTIAIAKNYDGSGHVVMVVPGNGLTEEGLFYPNTAQSGLENWGPDAGKTIKDSFRRIVFVGRWSEIQYFAWIP